jgi:hypothetical protein
MLCQHGKFPFTMKIQILILVPLLLFTLILSGQNWIRTYGVGNNTIARTVIEQYDKGYIICGSVNSSEYALLLKTDINGNQLWEKYFGDGSTKMHFSYCSNTMDNGFITCGLTTKLNSYDALITKFNSCAEIEWCKVLFTPNNYDYSWRIKQTPEGDFILLGAYFVTNPESNLSLFKFDASGELIWQQFYPFENYFNEDEPIDLLVDYDGYLITSTRYAPDTGTISPQIDRSYFVKTDTAGNKLWDLTYGTENQYYSYPWATTKNGNGKYYHSSTHSPPSGDNPALVWVSHDGLSFGEHDIFQMNNFNFSGFSTITMEDDSNIILVGGMVDNLGIVNWKVIKADTLGNLIDSSSVAFVNSSYRSTTKTFDGKFVTVGNDAPNGNFNIVAFKVNYDMEYDSIYTQPFTYDSLCQHPIVSDTIDPNCDNVIVSVDEPFKKPETTQLKVYPNPTDNMLTIELPKYLVVSNTSGNIPVTTIYHQWSSATLKAVDLQGNIVLQKEVVKTGVPLQLDVSKLPVGMYQFSLLYKGNKVAGCKVMVK